MTSPKRPAAKKPAAKRPAAKKSTAPARKRPAKKTAAAPPRVTPRDRKVVQRRQAGKALSAIARELKYRDAAAAHQAYERALDQTLPPPPEQQRRLELQQLGDREDVLWPKADAGSLAAIHELAQIHLERSRLKATGPAHQQQGPRRLGPVETATAQECEGLAKNAPSLAAAAIVLARLVDNTPEDGVAYAAAARELRMSMSNLRGLAGLQAPDGRSEEDQAAEGGPRPGDHAATGRGGNAAEKGGRVVVEPSRLQQLRERGDRA